MGVAALEAAFPDVPGVLGGAGVLVAVVVYEADEAVEVLLNIRHLSFVLC